MGFVKPRGGQSATGFDVVDLDAESATAACSGGVAPVHVEQRQRLDHERHPRERAHGCAAVSRLRQSVWRDLVFVVSASIRGGCAAALLRRDV